MRMPTLLVLLALLAGLAWPGPATGEEPADPANPLVVHEWGTFTSMQGSDGIGLEGLQHEEEVLPEFVYSRTKVRECPLRHYGYKGLEVPVDHVTQKMETPVLYFHTETPQRVRVRVDFVGGLITQWYPVSDYLGPAEHELADGPLDLAKVERSFLEWDVDLLPRSGPVPDEIPDVGSDDPWAYAREVDAAYVRTRPRTGEDRMGPVEAEHYLFYRGLGTFRMGYRVECEPGGRGRLIAPRQRGLSAVHVLETRPDGTSRWLRLGDVENERATQFDLTAQAYAADTQALADSIQRDLVAQGLAEDEARAMLRTWSRSWFTTEGMRVMYVVPRAVVDGLLPLKIDPEPTELVRVLVGRIECITPETEAEVEQALRDRRSEDTTAREAATARLMRLGRFLEPHVSRVLALTRDASVQESGREILETLRRP